MSLCPQTQSRCLLDASGIPFRDFTAHSHVRGKPTHNTALVLLEELSRTSSGRWVNGGAFSTGATSPFSRCVPGGWALVLHLGKPTYRGKHIVRSHTQGRPFPTQDRGYREIIIAGKSCRLSDLVSATAKPISCTWCSGFGDRTSRARGRTHLHRGGWAGAYQHIQRHRQTHPGRQTPSGLWALTLPGCLSLARGSCLSSFSPLVL